MNSKRAGGVATMRGPRSDPEESYANNGWFRRVILWEDPLFGW